MAKASTQRSGKTSSRKDTGPCGFEVRWGSTSRTKCRRRRTEIAAPSITTHRKRNRATSSDQMIDQCITRRFTTCSTTTAVSAAKRQTATRPVRRSMPSVTGGADLREEALELEPLGDAVLDAASLLA